MNRLQAFGTLFTPDTIRCWHRQLIAAISDKGLKQNRPCLSAAISGSIGSFSDLASSELQRTTGGARPIVTADSFLEFIFA